MLCHYAIFTNNNCQLPNPSGELVALHLQSHLMVTTALCYSSQVPMAANGRVGIRIPSSGFRGCFPVFHAVLKGRVESFSYFPMYFVVAKEYSCSIPATTIFVPFSEIIFLG